jgi:anti-sigma factor RsiW
MKRFLNPCRRYRQSLALLVAEALAGPERDRLNQHLAVCPDCQSHLLELKSTTVSLRAWTDSVAGLQPSLEARERWAKAVRSAASPKVVRGSTASPGAAGWWHDVVWSSRGIWAGLAAVWVLILAGNLSLRDHPQSLAGKSSSLPPSREMMMAYREQQTILNELLTDHSAPPDVDRPKFTPKPRTELVKAWTA